MTSMSDPFTSVSKNTEPEPQEKVSRIDTMSCDVFRLAVEGPLQIIVFAADDPGNGNDVKDMKDTTQCAQEIKKKVRDYVTNMNKDFACQGITKPMVSFAQDRLASVIDSFAEANKHGTVMCTMVFEKLVLDGTNRWVKECQMSVETDADSKNPKLDQKGHLGCEVRVTKKDKCHGLPRDDWEAGQKVFKMHAYLKGDQDPPHYRHEKGGEDPRTDEQTDVTHINPGKDLRVTYRCTTSTYGYTA